MAPKEANGQVKVCVGIESLWGALVNDLSSALLASLPELIAEAETVKGNGGVGTVYSMKFREGLPMSYQKEEVVERDDSVHRIAIQVIEGGHLAAGFTFYKNTMQLTAIGDSETQVDVTVSYVNESHEEMPPAEIVKTALAFIQALGNYLAKK